MGFLSPPPPPFDVDEWKESPYLRRIRPLVLRWVEHGTDVPGVIHLFYILKISLYALGGIALIGATSGLGGITDFGHWWGEPIVYQKAIVFTMLVEVLGFGGGSGPLFNRFLPPFTAFLHWFRPDTIRLAPWPRLVPFTSGDRRTVVDVALFTGFTAVTVGLLLSPGVGPVPPGATVGLLDHRPVIAMLALLAVIGLRDKAIWLAARAEMYWVASLLFLFPYTDMMIGLKLALVAIWIGAGVSKLTHIFPSVVAVMISNAPFRPKWFKRLMYRDSVNDIRPSRWAVMLAHSGTVIELGLPAFLLLGHGGIVSLVAVTVMVIFHVHIISTIPVGVPNEWNVFMILGTMFLFWRHADIPLTDLSGPWVVLLLGAVLGLPVIVGNLRPDLVSFLPSMRYYAGNWAIGLWCFRDGSERAIGENIVKASGLMTEQLTKLYDRDFAAITCHKMLVFRSMHPQGRALNALLHRGLPDIEDYTIFDGEPFGGALVGWNFGDGHLHNEQLLAAVQRRCHFSEGELRLIFLESQPLHVQRQRYRIVDAATGEIEAGYVYIKDLMGLQPWLDDDDPTVPVELLTPPPTPIGTQL